MTSFPPPRPLDCPRPPSFPPSPRPPPRPRPELPLADTGIAVGKLVGSGAAGADKLLGSSSVALSEDSVFRCSSFEPLAFGSSSAFWESPESLSESSLSVAPSSARVGSFASRGCSCSGGGCAIELARYALGADGAAAANASSRLRSSWARRACWRGQSAAPARCSFDAQDTHP